MASEILDEGRPFPKRFPRSCAYDANCSPLGKMIETFYFCWETYGSECLSRHGNPQLSFPGNQF